ncbi:galactokinase [Singulisphaera acidiphila]|uniref:Galactokinase n=1 Tax=Singulisphaera acidiphila (strain ATCC BAA-1392 / DSM 18658 / VKM B-2454 / MOB10) TaxID=886293 RepID=L0D7Z9_SINAD|nr:galactokinase [Singulisphaera acidiphila]AGA24990.1 galactokinase [Singulisphaera acidiphila DSM 18658]
MPSPLFEAARASYAEAFGLEPTVLTQAPGRVELLGNHTDYNGGLVLATAINRGTVIAGRVITEREGQVHSIGFAEPDRFAFEALEPGEPGTWGRYVRGVVWALGEAHGPLQGGFQAAIAGDVPLGAGLSSSASLQAALALFLFKAGLTGQEADLDDPARMALAKLLRRGENEFVGVQSGLLDQFSVLFGRAGMALSLDCRSLEYERLSLGNPPPAIVICDSKTSRRLADGMYNQRRAECERVVAYFQAKRGPEAVTWLRDVTVEELQAAWSQLDTIGRIRARHVLTENERVKQGAEALRAGDSAKLGHLMSESHASSRDDFGNSSSYLEALIESAEEAPGYLGGKLSGAGWAGCTVNLVDAAEADDFAEAVRHHYTRRTAIVPDVHICQAAAGASGF